MTKAEQETVIRWNREDQAVEFWTADPVVMRKLDRLGVPVQDETHAKRTGELTGRTYQPIPLARFRFGLKRERTAAQRAVTRRNAFGATTRAKPAGGNGTNGPS